jgi:hypothetical protein
MDVGAGREGLDDPGAAAPPVIQESDMLRDFGVFRIGIVAVALTVSGAGPTLAAPTPVAGVVVGGPGETTLNLSDLTESFVSPQSPEALGFGLVTQVNGLAGAAFCAIAACELTYRFRNYFPTSFNIGETQSSVVFAGGSVDFFLDTSPEATLEDATGFEDGIPWLSLIGYETTSDTGPTAGQTGTLFSLVTDALDPEKIQGAGTGFLQVVGGAAAEHFGRGNVMSFTSIIQPSPLGWTLPLAGPAELEIIAQGQQTEVPEPGTLALIAVGLLVLGTSVRRRTPRQCPKPRSLGLECS